MEFEELLQDVIRCDLCETPVPTRHCDVCDIHLCEQCKEKHVSDESKEHVIVSFEMRGSTPKCSIHSTEMCARYCKKCKTPICALCVSFGKHKRHKTVHISEMADGKEEPRRDDLQTIVKLGCYTPFCGLCVSSGKHEHHKTEETSKLSDGKKEPRKNNFQPTTNFTLSKKQRNWIIILCILACFIGVFDGYCLTFLVDQYSKIDRWLILFVPLFIVLILQIDLIMFFQRLDGGFNFDIGVFNLFFEYLKWLITRIKERRKNHLQTINFIIPEISVRAIILSFIIYVIGVCLFGVPVICFLTLN